MTTTGPSGLLQDFSTLFRSGALGNASDAALLERLRRGGDDAEDSLRALLHRHGPMVLGVCRRGLRDAHDAEDAFQATFLVLLRKAPSLRISGSLGGWLYGVSRRVVSRARVVAARRARHERASAGVQRLAPESSERAERDDDLAVLDQEIGRLPEASRTVLVLCELTGLTHETVAAELGCPVGTVESRLHRARERLRRRLVRRGLAPALLPVDGLLRPLVPSSLGASTVRCVAGAELLPPAISALGRGALTGMAWGRMRSGLLAIGTMGAACGLGLAAAGQIPDRHEPAPPGPVPKTSTPLEEERRAIADRLQPARKVQPGDVVRIEALQALPGRTLSGERVVRPDGTIGLDWYGDLPVAGLDRHAIKVKLLEHLRKFLNDEVLGLEGQDPITGARVAIPPAESNRVIVDDTPTYARAPNPLPSANGPVLIEPGDRLVVGVLETLPGRPLAGDQLVRPDGTINLDWYGEVAVAGLTRSEAKARIVEHLRKFLNDEALGLVDVDPDTGARRAVPPAESDHVFLRDDAKFLPGARERPGDDAARVEDLTRQVEKLERRLRALESKQGRAAVPPAGRPTRANPSR